MPTSPQGLQPIAPITLAAGQPESSQPTFFQPSSPVVEDFHDASMGKIIGSPCAKSMASLPSRPAGDGLVFITTTPTQILPFRTLRVMSIAWRRLPRIAAADQFAVDE